MNKYIIILFILCLFSCSTENAPNCLQNAGTTIQQKFEVEAFNEIVVFERIELIVKEDLQQKVIVETGEYLLNDIEVSVVNGELQLKNNNSCNLFREYGITKVFVNSPNITKIRNASGLDVSSDGILSYPSLKLISEDFNATEGDFRTDGNFNLQVNSQNITVITNSLTSVFISGLVESLNIRFFSGDGRFQGANLIAQHVEVFQRSSNDMIINPQQTLTGEIRSTGNVISLNKPPDVSVEEFYTGKLIFN